ncbi:MAG: TonB-dependent receptor, partial [Spongiibacteraceae bacterium]
MKKSKLASAISIALLSTGSTGWVHAQEEDGAHRGLEQVIVSARRVEENVQDVPIAITAMSAEQLEKSGVVQTSDLVQRAPSIQYQAATGRRDAAIFGIRGQKADDILLTSDQAVAVIIGGVPMNWAYGVGISGALDISSVEVAKGPQGTLFGKNSTGGAIIITPAEPNNSVEGMVKAGIGNYNLRQLEGMYNMPLTDTLAIRVAASATKQDGLADNLDGGEDFNSTDNWVGRISLKWQPTDALSSLFVIESMYSSASGPYGKPIAYKPTAIPGALYGPAFNAAQNDDFFAGHSDATHDGGYNDTQTWGVLNTTTFEVSPEITIKNIVGVRDLWYEGDADLDGVNRNDVSSAGFGLPPATAFALNRLQFKTIQFSDAQSVTEEIQLIGSHDIADWITGLYYSHTDGHDGSYSTQFNGLNLQSITGPAGGVTNQTIAAFAQSTWHLTDELNLTTGLRFTMDDREVTYISQTIANPPFQTNSCLLRVSVVGNPDAIPDPCKLQKNENFHEPTWNLSLDYKLTDSQLVYVATRHGYRSGGFSGRGQNTVTTTPFDQETVTDYELGYKIDGEIIGMPLRINTAVFYQDYKDIQRNITLTDGGTLQNAVRNAAA